MTFVTKQDAVKSARSWGVLGLVLALAFTVGVGYEQTLVSQAQQQPQPMPFTCMTVPKELNNPEDPEDENMNHNLFMLAVGFSSFAQDKQLLAIVQKETNNSPNKAVPYSKLIGRDRRFKDLMNVALRRCFFSAQPAGFDAYTHVANIMKVRGIVYYPELYIPNADTANWGQQPIIAVGAEINDNDEILGLVADGRGQLRQTTVGEKAAIQASVPIIIFNNGTTHIERPGGSLAQTHKPDAIRTGTQSFSASQSQSVVKFYIRDYQINHRYDKSNKSEYRMVYNIKANGEYRTNARFMFIADVDKSKIGTKQDALYNAPISDFIVTNTSACSNGHGPQQTAPFLNTNSYRITGVTFEYDWWAQTHTIVLDGQSFCPRMKFADEYYQLLVNVGLSPTIPNSGDVTIHGKGLILLQRFDQGP